mgnify:FL=1|jgi:hypothetical protein
MSGWGKKDDKTSTGTITITAPTVTFNGASAVGSATITSNGHPFRNGDYLLYGNGGGTTVVGLTSTSSYYVTNVTTNTFQLAASYHNAMMNTPTPIAITDGSGASHVLTLSFAKGIRATVTGSGTNFSTESATGDVIVTGTQELLITSITSGTVASVIGLDRQTAPAAASGAQFTLNEKPSSSASDANTDTTSIFGVDKSELVRGTDNVVSIAVNNGGAGYLEVPTIVLAAPTTNTVATAKVTIATDSIEIAGHNMPTGTKLTYGNGGGTALAGLADSTAYFVIVVDADNIKLASSLSNANAGTKITLTGTGNNNQTFIGDTATATAAVAAGAISAYTVTAVGSDYSGTAPAITIPVPIRTIPTSGVTIATESIAYTTHGLSEAFSIKYQDGGGTALAGLVDNTTYFVSGMGLTASAFRLATTAVAAAPSTLTTIVIGGTGGQFTCAASSVAVGDRVVVAGTFGGTGSINSYASGGIYKVSAITGSGSSVTGFTLTTEAGVAIVTVAGTPTGITVTHATLINLTGTGNNAQTFEVAVSNTGITQSTAGVSIGAGSGGASVAHTGWVKRTEMTGAHAGRVQYETLVALSKNGIVGDAADDIQFSE